MPTYRKYDHGKYTLFCEKREVINLLNKLPSADVVERKRGEWIVGTEQCTCCGSYGLISFNFCPNCGADMRGKSDE